MYYIHEKGRERGSAGERRRKFESKKERRRKTKRRRKLSGRLRESSGQTAKKREIEKIVLESDELKEL